MVLEPIGPAELPHWVPGRVLIASDALPWRGVSLRAYRYTPLDVEVPPLRDFMIVAYCRGPTPMDRRFAGRWRHEDLVPGDVSLLTRASESHWHWTGDIDVVHVYLEQRLMAEVCAEVFDREIADVHLLDILKTHDPILHRGALAIADEAAHQGLGGALYVEAVSRQLCIQALRNYSTVSFRDARPSRGLSALQARRIADYIEARLDAPLSLEELAGVVRLSCHHFLRQFKLRFGQAPHCYVMERRLERARQLLARSTIPLKEIAARSGFADQAHMCRLFRSRLATTPSRYRAAARS